MIDEMKKEFFQYVRNLQDEITDEIKKVDTQVKVEEDLWNRKDFKGNEGGGGRTRAFSGKTMESAGVNTSKVYGEVEPDFLKKLGGKDEKLWASGISLIIHPFNPRVPTVHANFRMITLGDRIWFGGGADLTPYYPNKEDFTYFHGIWADTLGENYTSMKKKCDDYFTNHHRLYEGIPEMRGIGGFFFDHYFSGDLAKDFKFVQKMGNNFIKSYFPIVHKRIHESFSEEDCNFQEHRRGRYVEFNLLHDRGTHFGLKTNGRTDSILISLPHRVKYSYQYRPRETQHVEMMKYYRPKNWI